MSTSTENDLTRFQWHPQPQAAALVAELTADLCETLPAAAQLSAQLRDQTGTRLIDWLDHIAPPVAGDLDERLVAGGFERSETGLPGMPFVWRHAAGMFPAILIRDDGNTGLAIKVESVEDFLSANGDGAIARGDGVIAGSPESALRIAPFVRQNGACLWVVERHGDTGFDPHAAAAPRHEALEHHRQAFLQRQRDFPDDAEGFVHAARLIDAANTDLGQARGCDLFFAAERAYWQRRNHAGRVQKAWQDALGLGWANHDHHTFRSSREYFTALIAVLEQLGFVCRERFYAGQEAGWGAQVLEQAVTGILVFADVDLAPEEVAGDFAHRPLAPQPQLSTIGLWCKLHGEAFLQAGLHHLECQFDFDAARAGLSAQGIASMEPFTDFPFLKQAFTQGEMWPVDPARLQAALDGGAITAEEAEQFTAQGALGSHLEILERNDGYKGFNQTGISQIILQTDPRRQ